MAENKPNIKTILLIIAGIVGYILIISVLSPYIKKNKKETVENKVVYIPSDIKKKYPEDFREDINILQRIKANIVSDYTQSYGGKHIHSYVDSKGRVIYKTTESIDADKNFIGKSGGYSYRRFYPDEEGYLYDKEDKIINKLEIKNFYEGFYYINTLSDMERKSYISTGFTGGTLKKLKYTYDEKGNMIKEERVKPSSWYEKEITEYSNGKKKTEKKIIDYEVDAEEYNKIYVEITKEYDETEKLIKKFVLRKNKFNALRSETNFDFIKGEIVTKYYDEEKAFATVTETLIGKDRAIVKRERVGDEFVIWDFVTYGKKVNNAPEFISDVYDRYIIKNNLIKTVYLEILEHGHSYNDTLNKPNGIDNVAYLDERIGNNLKDEFSVTSSYQVKEIIVYEDNKYSSYTIKEKIPIDLQLREREMNINNMKEYIISKKEEKNTIFNIELIIKKFKGEI